MDSIIAALSLISAAALISRRQHDRCESMVLLSVFTPRGNRQPDSASPSGSRLVYAYPELAQSDDVMAPVLSQTQSLLPARDPNPPATLAALQPHRLTRRGPVAEAQAQAVLSVAATMGYQ